MDSCGCRLEADDGRKRPGDGAIVMSSADGKMLFGVGGG